MREILGKAKTVRELLQDVKYSIDYYQREYMWQDKQVGELIDDLAGRFLVDHDPDHPRSRVQEYGRYFLGSIIISKKDAASYIVDGQQRLTTLTLLLIHLRNLQTGRGDAVNVDGLIFSERYGDKSFNLIVDERVPVMNALFERRAFEANNSSDSVKNIVARYRYLEEHFPEELMGDALPYFTDWLVDNVYLVEIEILSNVVDGRPSGGDPFGYRGRLGLRQPVVETRSGAHQGHQVRRTDFAPMLLGG